MKAVRLVLLLALGALLYRGGLAAYQSAPFELKVLEVRGNSGRRVTNEQIMAAAGVRKGAKLLEVSTEQVAQRVMAIPWIAKVRVERLLPSKLRIEVVERRPQLQVVTPAGSYLVDSEGLVLQEGSDSMVELRNLPVNELRVGEKLKAPEYVNAAVIYRSLSDRVRELVAAISAPTVDQTTILTFDGRSIFFGAAEQLEEKNFAIDSLYERSQPGAVIDVRVPSRPSVRNG